MADLEKLAGEIEGLMNAGAGPEQFTWHEPQPGVRYRVPVRSESTEALTALVAANAPAIVAALREVSALREALSDMLLRLDNKIALARDSNATLYGHSYVLCAGIEACIEASNARALATGEKP